LDLSRYQPKPSSQNYSLEDFTFPPAGRWPDPKTMIDELHQAGLHLVLWQIPVMKSGNPAEHLDETQSSADQEYAIQQKFVVQKADGSPHRIEAHSPWFANSLVLDFSNQKAVDWWFKKREYLLSELGVDGFKTDGGEHIWDTHTRFANGKQGSHGINTYPLEYEGAYDQFLRTHRLEDHVLFSRAGYAGIQKTSCHWTGDEKSSWEAFRASLRAMLNAGLCGVSFIGWDIAGFAGPTPGSDLYLRAAAFSVFCPIMQYHSDSNARREPSIDRTPWNIQEQTGDPDVIPIFRKFTNLRMNLVPYILNQAQESSQSGLPLMRSLFLEYPSDATGREFPYEYKFGNALLVAPVVDEGITSANVYLPEGDWSDFWSGKLYSGSQIVTIETPKDCIPVFQCKGSIVPLNLGESLELGSPVGNSIEEVSDLVLLIFPGETTRVEVFQGKGLEPLVVASQLDAMNDTVQVQLMGLKIPVDLMVSGYKPNEVRINGVVVSHLEESNNSTAFWTWMLDRNAVRIHITEFQGAVMVFLS
jgi:alpha-D-xyloside xylohydrolase